MSVVPLVFRAQTAEELESTLNAVLAPLLNVKIYGVIIDQAKEAPANSKNLAVSLTYNTVGGVVLATPFQAKAFTAPTEVEAVAQLVAFTLANPTYFFSEVYPVYRPYAADPNAAICLVLFYHPDSVAAQTNWSAPGSISAPAMAVDMSNIDAALRTPYPVADFDDFNFLPKDTSTNWGNKWWSWTFGSGAGTSIDYPGNETAETGVVRLATGTTTTGRTGLIYGYSLNWEPSVGKALIRGKVSVDTVPDALEAYAFQLGLMNDTAQDGSGGSFFSADDTSPFWQCCYVSGGLNKVPTTVPITAGAWMDLAITINETATVVHFWINGVIVYTADISLFDGGGSYGVRIQKKAGTTNRNARVDWLQGVLGNKYRPAIASILPGQ
jgi:hypothetical protein